MKKKFLIALLLALVFVFTGCSNVDFTIIEYQDGSLNEVYTLEFDKTEFTQLGATDEDVQKLQTRLLNRLHALAGNDENPIGHFETDFISRVNSSNLNTIERDNLITGFNCELSIYDNVYSLMFSYKNLETYRFFHGISEESVESSKDDMVIEKKLFTYKIIQKSVARFGAKITRDDDSETTLGIYLFEETKKDISELISPEFSNRVVAPTFTYTYATSSKRLHSDCDRLLYDYGYYFHVWELSIDNLDKEIIFYNIEARRETWYITILGATFLFVIALVITAKIKNSNKNKKKLEKNENFCEFSNNFNENNSNLDNTDK